LLLDRQRLLKERIVLEKTMLSITLACAMPVHAQWYSGGSTAARPPAPAASPVISAEEMRVRRQLHDSPAMEGVRGFMDKLGSNGLVRDPRGLVDYIRRYQSMKPADPAAMFAQGNLYILVSFSMPEPLLKALANQARSAGGVLVIRGFHGNSMPETVAKVYELMEGRPVTWRIDPRVFDDFDVQAVPTIVVVKPNTLRAKCQAADCRGPDDWGAISGGVTLDYALETIASRQPTVAGESNYFLSKLRGRK
jgi:type-F conjugative transfer system pilin assembly protein TrbC